MPGATPRRSSSSTAAARWPAKVGEPIWSSTTRSGSLEPLAARFWAAARMVFTKLAPVAEKSHDVRMTVPWSQARVSCSAASLVRP